MPYAEAKAGLLRQGAAERVELGRTWLSPCENQRAPPVGQSRLWSNGSGLSPESLRKRRREFQLSSLNTSSQLVWVTRGRGFQNATLVVSASRNCGTDDAAHFGRRIVLFV